MFIVLKTSRFLFKEGVGLQWIVPGLNSLSQREVEALRVEWGTPGPGTLAGTQRKVHLSWLRRSGDVVGQSALHRGLGSPGAIEPSG